MFIWCFTLSLDFLEEVKDDDISWDDTDSPLVVLEGYLSSGDEEDLTSFSTTKEGEDGDVSLNVTGGTTSFGYVVSWKARDGTI